ncbi:FAD-binding domain-containing protein [Parathielavia hyrcaniae]|uniref:FAD-binding domain-containing protein n=1 Tax=Parathielavia hyrcaniae TaxID=113614 RepID=A0AAN6SYV0_9PEZI|nr:FAD-binding domain-containing protein [Parathielavia hyrcaniae]
MATTLPTINQAHLLALLISIATTLTLTLANLPPSSPHHNPPLSLIHSLSLCLSPSARLLHPTDPAFQALLASRWSTNPSTNRPSPSLILLAATEADISHAIRHANAHNLPFLATTGGHGINTFLSHLDHNHNHNHHGGGLLISLRNLTHFTLSDSPTSKTATFGSGLLSHEVIDRLWRAGKQTTTGSCGCVSYAGPAMGGGHGYLQGRYGLVADQVVSARVVLADGRVVVASEEEEGGENGDLFWAVRGAGHNFGVVSEFTVRVYDVEEGRRDWGWEEFVFVGARLEEVYELAGEMMEGQPVEVVFWSVWRMVEEVDPVKPAIVVTVFFNGPLEEARRYTQQIRDLGPATYRFGVTEYPKLNTVLGVDLNGPGCQPQGTALLRAADVDRYDIDALRNWFDIFSQMLATEKAFAGSACLLEGYGVQGVQAVPSDSTAFPHRDKRLLLAPNVLYDVVGNSTLDREAKRWGEAMVTAAFGGAQRRTYVNYALGNESLQAMYGYEPWRLPKLQALKRKYDPENRFRFFAPIVRGGGSGNAVGDDEEEER